MVNMKMEDVSSEGSDAGALAYQETKHKATQDLGLPWSEGKLDFPREDDEEAIKVMSIVGCGE